MKLLAGTKNADKYVEISEILIGLEVELVFAGDIADLPDVEEDKPTIEGNAVKKACEMAAVAGMYTIADDTGLFVDALAGAPGVYSARYAGENCSYKDNRDKLLVALSNPELSRTASFRTVVALADPEGKLVAIAEGRADGVITKEEHGDKGFGYDSIFYSQELKKTFAQMSSEEKHKISHRGRALSKMVDIIKNELLK